MNVTAYTIVAAHLRIPASAGEKTEFLTVACKATDCPLLAAGKCIHFEYARWVIGGNPCVHGKAYRVEGYTKRARAWSAQKDAWQKEITALRNGKGSVETFRIKSMIEIDGWVMLPYDYMNGVESVPWVAASGFMQRGVPWIKREDFTPETIIRLSNAYRMSLMGGRIEEYNKLSVPRFLYDLWVMFPDLYAAACDIEPSIDNRIAGRDFFTGYTVPVASLKLPERITKLDGTEVNGVLMRDELGHLVLTVEGNADDVRLQGVYGAIDPARQVRAMFPILEGRMAAPESSAARHVLWESGAYCQTKEYKTPSNSKGTNHV